MTSRTLCSRLVGDIGIAARFRRAAASRRSQREAIEAKTGEPIARQILVAVEFMEASLAQPDPVLVAATKASQLRDQSFAADDRGDHKETARLGALWSAAQDNEMRTCPTSGLYLKI
jgi:hypothetical protein